MPVHVEDCINDPEISGAPTYIACEPFAHLVRYERAIGGKCFLCGHNKPRSAEPALHAAGIEQAVRTGQTYLNSLRIVRPDGAVRNIQMRGEVVRDAAGRVTGLSGTVIDVTEPFTPAHGAYHAHAH